jgi:hypothetical protein
MFHTTNMSVMSHQGTLFHITFPGSRLIEADIYICSCIFIGKEIGRSKEDGMVHLNYYAWKLHISHPFISLVKQISWPNLKATRLRVYPIPREFRQVFENNYTSYNNLQYFLNNQIHGTMNVELCKEPVPN